MVTNTLLKSWKKYGEIGVRRYEASGSK